LEIGQSNHLKEAAMNFVEFRDASRNVALVAATALLVAIAAWPIAADLMRTLTAEQPQARAAKITLTCFDREMRAHRCEVASTTVAATPSGTR
jgi:hypothetical protein